MVKQIKERIWRPLWHIVYTIVDIMVEPCLLAFALFIMFPHWQNVYNTFTDRTAHGFVCAFWKDMTDKPTPWIVFGVIFLL